MTSIKKARKASRFINLHGLRHVPHKPTVYHRKLRIGEKRHEAASKPMSKKAREAFMAAAIASAMLPHYGEGR